MDEDSYKSLSCTSLQLQTEVHVSTKSSQLKGDFKSENQNISFYPEITSHCLPIFTVSGVLVSILVNTRLNTGVSCQCAAAQLVNFFCYRHTCNRSSKESILDLINYNYNQFCWGLHVIAYINKG